MTPEELIKTLAEFSAVTASNAGVGGCETAGMIVSALHAHPELIPQFFENPSKTLHDNFEQMKWENGSLTWHAVNGDVVSPAELRAELGKKTVRQSVFVRLRKYYSAAEVSAWMKRPHPQLDGKAAIDVMFLPDGEERVHEVIDRLESDGFL